jgi:hypothetical protein
VIKQEYKLQEAFVDMFRETGLEVTQDDAFIAIECQWMRNVE